MAAPGSGSAAAAATAAATAMRSAPARCPSPPLARQWRTLTATATATPTTAAPSPTLRVLEFNVLADGLAQHGNFAHCDGEQLAWAGRFPQLLAEIAAQRPDLVLLPECNNFGASWAPAMAARGYAGLHADKRPSPVTRVGSDALRYAPDGVGLFFRTSRFTLLELPADPPPPAAAAAAAAGGGSEGLDGTPAGAGLAAHVFHKDPVQVVAALCDREHGGRPLLLSGLHLKAKEGMAALRLKQTQQALARLRALRQAWQLPAGAPTLLAGDFNAEEHEPCVAEVLAAGLDSAYGAGQPAWTTWKIRSHEVKHTIDYIFASAGLAPTAVMEPPSDADARLAAALPCPHYPSDHIAIAADFQYTGQQP